MPDLPIAPGLPSLAGLRLAVQQNQWKTLADLLLPGAQLTAQVDAHLGGNSWQLRVSGRPIVAESPVPLPTGGSVQLEVLTNDGTPQVRLIASSAIAPTHADPASQLARLGVPDEPAARTVLQAFTAAGAPLIPARIAEATAALRPQPGNHALAEAYATVARSGLPAVPLSIDLALRAAVARPPAVVPPPTTPPATAGPAALPAPPVSASPSPATPAGPPPTVGGPAGIAGTAPMAPASAPPATSPVVTRMTETLPGPTGTAPSDDAPAMERALHHAGLRREAPASDGPGMPAPHRAKSSHRVGDDDLPALVTRIAQTFAAQQSNGTASAEARSAFIDATAHTLFPPKELADYDLVVPLPIQERGSPVPARLAVSTRRTAGGVSATWLRVDTELSQLGPVSTRLAAMEHGPLLIHLVVTPAALSAMEAVIPDLQATLESKGFTATIRVSTDDG